MDILKNLFNELGDVVSTFSGIASTFTTPIKDLIQDFPAISALVDLGFFDPVLTMYPNMTLFGMMFGVAIGFTIVYTLIKWILDIVL